MSTTLGVASSSLFSGRPRLFGDSSKPKITIISISARPNTLTSAEKSHEEWRVSDYFNSYTTTGKRPDPPPIEPTSDRARAALGLPAAFTPYIDAITPIDLPGEIEMLGCDDIDGSDPFLQVFLPKPKIGEETLMNITSVPRYKHFSTEELRVYANLKASLPHIPDTTTSSSSVGLTATSSVSPYYSNHSTSTAYHIEQGFANGIDTYYQSMTASERYNKHSFEEFRVAYAFRNKDHTSSELLNIGNSTIPGLSLGAPLFVINNVQGDSLPLFGMR